MKFTLEIELTDVQAESPWRVEEIIQGVAYSMNQFVYEGQHANYRWWLDPEYVEENE